MQFREECSRRKDIVIKSTINIPLSEEQIIKVTSFMVQCEMEDNESEIMQHQEQKLKCEQFTMQFIQNSQNEQEQDKDALQVRITNIQQQLLMDPNIENIEIFITKIAAIYEFEQKHHILALIFLKKIQIIQQFNLDQNNWQPLTIISFMLAIEFWDNFTIEQITSSEKYINSAISKYFNKEILTKLRIEFLQLLGIKGVIIKTQLFYKYTHDFLSLVNQFYTQNYQIPTKEFQQRAEVFSITVQKILE